MQADGCAPDLYVELDFPEVGCHSADAHLLVMHDELLYKQAAFVLDKHVDADSKRCFASLALYCVIANVIRN